MRQILITGANSYIGTSFEQSLEKFTNQYKVDTVDVSCSEWKNKDFSKYDAVFHVAGIAHSDIDRVTSAVKKKYYNVNCDLAVEVAEKAKEEGVRQFIFMSSISIYGDTSGTKPYVITKDTAPKPGNVYGGSKLKAEKKLKLLNNKSFGVVLLRSPMIYGKDSKGNYKMLSKIAKVTPIFPKINSKRSMLHIDNLCEFVRLIIDNQERGIFFPQNREYVNISMMVQMIAKVRNRRLILVPGFNWFIYLLGKVPGRIGKLTNKAFGSIQYDMKISEYKDDYRVRNLIDSIRYTER